MLHTREEISRSLVACSRKLNLQNLDNLFFRLVFIECTRITLQHVEAKGLVLRAEHTQLRDALYRSGNSSEYIRAHTRARIRGAYTPVWCARARTRRRMNGVRAGARVYVPIVLSALSHPGTPSGNIDTRTWTFVPVTARYSPRSLTLLFCPNLHFCYMKSSLRECLYTKDAIKGEYS